MNKNLDALAIGSAYLDTNASDYSFGDDGIRVDTELIGGEYENVPGGSAVTFCLLLGRLGLMTAFVGMAGTDQNGDILSRLLQESGVRPVLSRRPDLQTNISYNVTNLDGKHIMLVAGTANAALNGEAVLSQLESVASDTKLLYLGGCFKLKSLAGDFMRIADVADQHGMQIVVDHNRIPGDVSDEMLAAVKQLVLRAAYYFPARDEFCELWNVPDVETGLRQLHGRAPHLVVVVKDGDNGAFHGANDAVQHVPTNKVEKVVHATGAGDSFNAGVMTALANDQPLATAITYGCRVAAAKIAGQPLPQLQ